MQNLQLPVANFMISGHRFFTKQFFLPAILFLSVVTGAVHITQKVHDNQCGNRTIIEDFNYLPSGVFLKGAALSFDEVLADLLWIKALGYFGAHAKGDQNYQWLNRLLDITTTLDPYFHDPYEFGGIVLSWELGDVEAGTKILQKGMENVPKHHPRYWYLPFFTAFNYMYYKHDYQQAAKDLVFAATFPQSPKYLPLLVSRLYANTEDPGLAIPFLEEMLAQSDTPEMRESLKKRIKEIEIKKHLSILSSASKKFERQTGRSLKKLDELINYGILKALPAEPFGGQYEIQENGAIQSTSQIDDMELHIDKNKKGDAPMIFLQESK
jgi:hypothetical protein